MIFLFSAVEGTRRSKQSLNLLRNVWVWEKSLKRSFSRDLQQEVQREQEVQKVLKDVIEPISQRKIGALGCIQKIFVLNDEVKVNLDTFVPGYPFRKEIKSECEKKLKDISWMRDYRIEFMEKPFHSSLGPTSAATFSPLTKIHHIIGVSSCKGGVGKSTVAVNLACALAMRPGLRIGILDADIYGPSLPIQLKPTDFKVKRSAINPQRFILPLISHDLPNLKMLSFGFVNPNSGAPGSGGKSAAMMRGPMASKVINQLLLGTDWDELDYLIVDMPPGTGDIQLTLSQTASFSGAVIVTTPHLLSLLDAAKGVELFRAVNIPTLALVENMSYFKCDAGKLYHPFGKGGRDALLDSLSKLQSNQATTTEDIRKDIEKAPYFSFPLCMEGAGMTTNQRDSASATKLLDAPLVISCPETDSAKIYHDLATAVISQLFQQQILSQVIPSVYHDRTANGLRLRYFTATQAKEYFLPSATLRKRDPKTAAEVVLPQAPTSSIVKIDLKGVYGVGVTWSDRSDIYSYDVLKEIAESLVVN